MKKKLLILFGLITITAITLSDVSFASYKIDNSYKPKNAPFTELNFSEGVDAEFTTSMFLQIIAGALLYFAAPIAVIMIAWGAFDMVMGGADSEKLEQSKKHLTWTIIGLILIIISYSAVRFVLDLIIKSGEVPTPNPPAGTEQPAAPAT